MVNGRMNPVITVISYLKWREARRAEPQPYVYPEPDPYAWMRLGAAPWEAPQRFRDWLTGELTVPLPVAEVSRG